MKNALKKIISLFSYFVNCLKLSDPETHLRRMKLKEFAKKEFEESNRAIVLTAIVEFGVSLVRETEKPSKNLISDIKAVLIGRNMTICRGKGAYFAGNIEGAEGFKNEYQDPWNQVQHAIAGIVIAYQYGKTGEVFVKLLEGELQDILLYEATFPLGDTLNDDNYTELPKKFFDAIS